ncbi:TIGR04150 pseudo-rSAM protein, partial [Enterocloster citroniae]
FLQSLPENLVFNIKGEVEKIHNNIQLVSFFENFPSSKYIYLSYKEATRLKPELRHFSYKVSIDFPLEMNIWETSITFFNTHRLDVEYIFMVSCVEEFEQSERVIEKYGVGNFVIKPIYTGSNIDFFKNNIFLTKEDILSSIYSIKDFFIKQSMNISDFGKLNIMSNGDVYANLNHPVLGNIYKNSIIEIVQKEITEGKSWFRIRNEQPCTDCLYQWLCPSPSDYELIIKQPNLCHVKNKINK